MTPGHCGGAFSTTTLPAASAGPILWHARFTGALNGVIAATTPMGKRSSMAILPKPIGEASRGTCSPSMRTASSAERLSVSTDRSISAPLSRIGLPVSRLIVSAMAGLRATSNWATRRRIFARSVAGSFAAAAFAPTAAARARSRSAAFERGAVETGEPRYGSQIS